MNIRKIDTNAVIACFTRAVDLGGRNPKAVFGAALLALVVVFGLGMVVMLVATAVAVGAGFEPQSAGPAAALALAAPIMLFFMVLMPVLGGGMMHVVHESESGRPVSALGVFAGFRGGRLLSLAGLAILPLAGLALTLLNYRVFGGPTYFAEYTAMMEAAMKGVPPVPPEARSPALMFVVGMLLTALQNLLQLVTVPAVQLGRRSTLGAIADGLAMVRHNPGPSLLLLVLGFAAMLAVALVMVVVAVVLGVIAGLLPLLGVPLALLVMLAFAAVLVVVYTGVSYFAWRSQFAPEDTAAGPPPMPAQLEA